MLIGRVLANGRSTWARRDPDGVFALNDALHEDERPEAITGEVRLLPPILPHNKIIGLLDNFAGRKGREGPGLFLKNHTSVIAHQDAIRWSSAEHRPSFEAELAVVIGREGRHIDAAAAREFILGYTIANDLTCFDTVRADGLGSLSSRFKLFDNSFALGPWIETEFEPQDGAIRSFVNGVLKQDAKLADMAFGVAETIAWVSAVMTLHPGDVISMGTPPGFEPLADGDLSRCEIPGIGALENCLKIDRSTSPSPRPV